MTITSWIIVIVALAGVVLPPLFLAFGLGIMAGRKDERERQERRLRENEIGKIALLDEPTSRDHERR
jgi:hypothetical protein